jgi:hypothetical protein
VYVWTSHLVYCIINDFTTREYVPKYIAEYIAACSTAQFRVGQKIEYKISACNVNVEPAHLCRLWTSQMWSIKKDSNTKAGNCELSLFTYFVSILNAVMYLPYLLKWIYLVSSISSRFVTLDINDFLPQRI